MALRDYDVIARSAPRLPKQAANVLARDEAISLFVRQEMKSPTPVRPEPEESKAQGERLYVNCH
jgi:hypothetical protein